jgi:hypothetical protein
MQTLGTTHSPTKPLGKKVGGSLDKYPHHPVKYNQQQQRKWVTMSVIVRTEKWGDTIKAVVRTDKGTFIGATNQTAAVPFQIVGKK